MRSTLLAILTLASAVLIHAQTYSVSLSGNHQPFPVLSQGYGVLTATLHDNTLSVDGEVHNIVSGIDTNILGGMHIHMGLAGQNGPVQFVLRPTLSEGLNGGLFDAASNTFILDEDTKDALVSRQLYVNVHSVDHGGGELRGQILPEADELYTANLVGSNAVPPVMSDGIGSVALEVHGDTVVVSGSFENLSSPVATDIAGGLHIHRGLAGQNGGVVQPLQVTLDAEGTSGQLLADSNTYVFSQEQLDELRGGGWYLNLHTTNVTSGELRGQLTPPAKVKMRAHLTGASEAPSVTSFAAGMLALDLSDDDMLTVSGSFSGLESDLNVALLGGGHIHLGMAGANGGVAFPLDIDVDPDMRGGQVDPAKNVFPINIDTLTALLGRALYVNIHSMENAGGELRGQILPISQYYLHAYTTAGQQINGVRSDASGASIIEVLGNMITVTGSFSGLGSALNTAIAGGAHVHFAPAGSSGPNLFNLVATPGDTPSEGRFRAADNQFDIADTRRDSLRARMGYLNIHSMDNPGGEIRGQYLHEATAYFFAPLSGAEQTPTVLSDGVGAAAMEYNGQRATISGSFAGLGSTVATQILGGAHLHIGLPGASGPVSTALALNLNDDMTAGGFAPMDNSYALSAGLMDTVRKRMTYINVHTNDHTGGEIRGQFRPFANGYFLANLRGKHASSPAPSSGQGALLFEKHGSALTAVGSLENLVGDFNESIAGGAHLHLGMAGMNGPIGLSLASELTEDLKGAAFLADSNQFVMDDTLATMLRDGNTYVNIHTTAVPAGEIRGQSLLEINQAPASTSFLTPGSGDTISIEGDPGQAFALTWSPSDDPNGNRVVYLWQLSLESEFEMPLISVNTGESTAFGTTFGVVDSLLSLLGLDSGESVTLYHRIVASDGSLCSETTVDSVVVAKGLSTGLQENPFIAVDYRLYPNPVQHTLHLEIEAKQSTKGRWQVLDPVGRMLQHGYVSLRVGRNVITRAVGELPAGHYLFQLTVSKGISLVVPFVRR